MRILVVEDDFLVADAIRRGLCMSGFAVDCTCDAEQAAGALAAEHFDLALLDIALPGTDGLTFLRRLRNSGSHLPVEHIELTGREWLIVECLALNSGRIVTKERLQQAVTSWDQAITPNAIEVHVSRVRAKLGESVVLRAVRGLGYRLDEPR